MIRGLLFLFFTSFLVFANDVTELLEHFSPNEVQTQYIEEMVEQNPGFTNCQRRTGQLFTTCFNDFLCTERRNYLEQALGQGQSVEDAFSEITRADPQMIFLGEQHYLQNTTDDYSNILQSLRNDRSNLDCLFLEIPNNATEIRAIEAIKRAFPVEPMNEALWAPLSAVESNKWSLEEKFHGKAKYPTAVGCRWC